MSRTLVIAGKIGPAFNGGEVRSYGTAVVRGMQGQPRDILARMIEIIAGNVCEGIAWHYPGDYARPHEVSLGDALDVLTR